VARIKEFLDELDALGLSKWDWIQAKQRGDTKKMKVCIDAYYKLKKKYELPD
jgi:hypothetical protein